VNHHLHLLGDRKVDRSIWLAAHLSQALTVCCHRRLRGPYTGVDTLLKHVLPDAVTHWPELVEEHRLELLYGMPELAGIIGHAPRTLASESSFRERTRFFSSDMIRCMNQGIVTFLTGYARRLRDAGGGLPDVVFEDADTAEPTTQEFVALLLRRCPPELVRIVVSGGTGPLPGELEEELRASATRVHVPPASASPGLARSPAELAEAYVAGHGTSDDPAEIEAYLQANAAARARWHDEQADVLEAVAGPSLRAAALAWHREHGSDPSGAGAQALEAAQQYCVEAGFSQAVIDLGMRGRAVTDIEREPKRYCDFTSAVANALVPLGRLNEALQLYQELRGRFTLPKVHMTTSYAIAMLHTRFLTPRDHEAAMQWENNAAAIASTLPDERDRLVFGVFQDNALALIEMHRGHLHRALELVQAGLARLDATLKPGEWVLHRSQLLYNGARLKAALGDTEAARADFTTLIDMDPYYTDYLCERARLSRKAGDLQAALADYDRAVLLAPPFPELHFNRGTARAAAGDTEGAFADFRFVLEMEPRDLETRLSYAELLLGTGDIPAAMEQVCAGLVYAPGEPRLLCLQGVIHLERAEAEAALEVLDQAVARDPDYPAALLNRAVARHETGQSQRSAEDLTRLLDLIGEDPDVLLNRGIAYRAAGRPDLAQDDFDRAMGLPGADLDELRQQRMACRAGR